MHSIRLITGTRFDLDAPRAEDIEPNALGHALSLINRFAGHCPVPYSVAEHSVRVALLVPPKHMLAALLHDAHEGLGLGDTIGPLKRMLPGLRNIEADVDAAVCERFGLEPGALLAPEIKHADRLMLRAEFWYLHGYEPHLGEGSEELQREMLRRVAPFEPWSAQNAKAVFLSLLCSYCPGEGIQPTWRPPQMGMR